MHDKGKQTNSKWSSQENDISKIALGPGDASRINKKKQGGLSTTSKVEKVEYSPMLKNFLNYLEDKEILELTGTVPNQYFSIFYIPTHRTPISTTSNNMRLHSVLSDLRTDLKKTTEQFQTIKKNELPW